MTSGRRLHRDPSIISRLYAAYALTKLGGDLTSPPYRTLPRERLCPLWVASNFLKLIRHDALTASKAVGKPVKMVSDQGGRHQELLPPGCQMPADSSGPRHPGPDMVGWSHKVACTSAVARCIFHIRLPVAPSMPRVYGLARFGATGDVDPGAGTPCSFRRNPR
jgi:hypothetical protein